MSFRSPNFVKPNTSNKPTFGRHSQVAPQVPLIKLSTFGRPSQGAPDKAEHHDEVAPHKPNFVKPNLIERTPSPRGGFLYTLPHQEP